MAFDLRPEPEEPKPWLNKRPLARSSEVKEEQARAAAVKQQQNMSLAAEIAAAATSLSQTYKVAAFDEDAGAFKPRLLTEMHKRPKAAAAAGRANGDDDLDPEETGPDKKKRGDPHKSFNAKEKRKRELGQSSRALWDEGGEQVGKGTTLRDFFSLASFFIFYTGDKSYVEEEKRILRAEMTRKAGYGFD